MSEPLECYGLIGDCETAALVSDSGSIDWLCWPRFDSAACFAALLGGPEHGRWMIAPAEDAVSVAARYRHDTLILETRFETGGGAVTLVDFMPPRGRNSDVVRIVQGERGRVRLRMELTLRFDYGADGAVGDADVGRGAPRDCRPGPGRARTRRCRCAART